MNRIFSLLKTEYGLSDERVLDAIQRDSYVEHVDKGEHLLIRGDKPKGVCILMEGVLRGYFNNYKGDDITDCFGYQFGQIAMPYADFMQPSPINIVALSPSVVFVVPATTVLTLLFECTEVVSIYNKWLLAASNEHWEIKTAMYQFTAEQRYLWFLNRYPGLINMVSHRYIASFLGMSPVTLSRIRGKLRDINSQKE